VTPVIDRNANSFRLEPETRIYRLTVPFWVGSSNADPNGKWVELEGANATNRWACKDEWLASWIEDITAGGQPSDKFILDYRLVTSSGTTVVTPAAPGIYKPAAGTYDLIVGVKPTEASGLRFARFELTCKVRVSPHLLKLWSYDPEDTTPDELSLFGDQCLAGNGQEILPKVYDAANAEVTEGVQYAFTPVGGTLPQPTPVTGTDQPRRWKFASNGVYLWWGTVGTDDHFRRQVRVITRARGLQVQPVNASADPPHLPMQVHTAR
jgi:hypothetical protein